MPTGIYTRRPRGHRFAFTCEHCGTAFTASPNRVAARKDRIIHFCSIDCRLAAARLTLICRQCGEPFASCPSALKHGRNGAQFCSAPCRRAYQARASTDWALIVERFWSHVRQGSDPDACWGWSDTIDAYGQFSYVLADSGERRAVGAHVFSYELHVGPVPDGLNVLHSCDNPPCPNPRHLRAGTDQDNSDDKLARGRQARGERAGLARLDADRVLDIRRRVAAGETQIDVARAHGVYYTTVSKIVRRQTWKHI